MQILKQTDAKATLSPGLYIISDPCYQVPNDKWDDLLSSCHVFDEPVGHYKAGRKIVHVIAFGTAYGNGSYYDQDGTEYGVDAGLIGIMLVSDIGKKMIDSSLGRLVTFTEPFECYSERGVIHFGHIEIDTDPREEEDYDY